jgi:hypothetical protein
MVEKYGQRPERIIREECSEYMQGFIGKRRKDFENGPDIGTTNAEDISSRTRCNTSAIGGAGKSIPATDWYPEMVGGTWKS